MFVKTDFQVLKLKFLAFRMNGAFYPLHKQNFVRSWQQENTFKVFRSVPGCQTCIACINAALVSCCLISRYLSNSEVTVNGLQVNLPSVTTCPTSQTESLVQKHTSELVCLLSTLLL